MSEQQTKILSLKAAYEFGAAHGLGAEVQAIRDMTIEWDRSYTSSLRRGYIVELFERHGLVEQFKAEHWQEGNTPWGQTKIRLYKRIREQYLEFLQTGEPATDGAEAEELEEAEQQFAAEADLRDFLALNPGCIEPGLRLYATDGKTGIEYAVDGGFIDLLMVDREDRFVVIELKVGRGRNRTIGQLLYYMGWVDKHLGKAPCRGMIIAKEITPDLLIAAQRVPGVSLHRYTLSVSIHPVSLTE